MKNKIISTNRRARYDYFIDDTIEAGIVLTGSEVKSILGGKVNFVDSYINIDNNEAFLINMSIAQYKFSRENHEEKRLRKLLLKKKEINKLFGITQKKGVTLIPLCIYFNEKNKVKVEVGVCRGKKDHDKRQAIKDREWKRDKQELLK